LVQDRPVLGGNASSEIGIVPAGLGNPIVDAVAGAGRASVLATQDSLHLWLGWRACGVRMEGERIAAVAVREVRTAQERLLSAPLFVDCTGDGWLGYWAGADYRMGREGRDEFGESLAPLAADRMTHGSTLYFAAGTSDRPRPFPPVPWARAVAGDHTDLVSSHSWEYGHWLDAIADAEEIRDHLLAAIYGTFANARASLGKAGSRLVLTRLDYIAARGESRRLMGDHILTEPEIRSGGPFADAVATGSCVFCLHYPGTRPDFRSDLRLTWIDPYPIPFRCLYSRNVPNLMMAGRDVSASHIAFSSVKLMKTGGQMGVAVGAAASLCKLHGIDPRGVGAQHTAELQATLKRLGQDAGPMQ
jgi:hypothetical protein